MSVVKKGDKVFIRDYPFGQPLNVHGIVVGILENDYYNIKLSSGFCEGNIVKYKVWKLYIDISNKV